MRKIKSASISQKDRVICVTVQDSHKFYYQPASSKERIFLFATNCFSGSVFAYFRDRGRALRDREFSLTIKELYEFNHFHNKKLVKIHDRILLMIDYVVRVDGEFSNSKNQYSYGHIDKMLRHCPYRNTERAA